MDSPQHCLDRHHFDSYLSPIEYVYNSRGFRDREWPDSIDQLSDAVWCIGDSFTAGIGSPVEHTWPFLLSQRLDRQTINVSMDGASNAWIERYATQIQQQVKPKNMVIMWSYLHRRENSRIQLSSEQQRLHFERTSNKQDIDHFKSVVDKVNSQSAVVNFTVPRFSPFYEIDLDIKDTWADLTGSINGVPQSQDELSMLANPMLREKSIDWERLENLLALKKILNHNKITEVYNLDYARDGHHFDQVTAHWVVDRIIDQLR
jgi:hypothetical protein